MMFLQKWNCGFFFKAIVGLVLGYLIYFSTFLVVCFLLVWLWFFGGLLAVDWFLVGGWLVGGWWLVGDWLVVGWWLFGGWVVVGW